MTEPVRPLRSLLAASRWQEPHKSSRPPNLRIRYIYHRRTHEASYSTTLLISFEVVSSKLYTGSANCTHRAFFVLTEQEVRA